jgi:hypothetical protein
MPLWFRSTKTTVTYVRFYQAFRRDWSDSLQDFNAFVISAKGSIQMKPFSFEYLADAVESGPAT